MPRSGSNHAVECSRFSPLAKKGQRGSIDQRLLIEISPLKVSSRTSAPLSPSR
jgi:hypothetical protein